jgi:hypothetical protein
VLSQELYPLAGIAAAHRREEAGMSGKAPVAGDRARRRIGRASPLIALCVLLCGSCSGAKAQSWQCRAPEGTFADHDIEMPKNATQLTGEMMIRKAAGLSRWHPTARVAFNDTELADSGCHCNGVVATWYPENPDVFAVFLSVDGKQIPVGHVPYDKPVRFKLSFSWDGALKLELGDVVETAQSATPIRDNLHMSCSTADADFSVTVVPPEKPSTARCALAAREQWSGEDFERYCRAHGS